MPARSQEPREYACGRRAQAPLEFRSVAVVPVAAVAVRIGPVPAQIGSRATRDHADGGDRNDRAEHDARNDSPVIRPAHPRPGVHKAAPRAYESRPDVPRSSVPELCGCGGAAGHIQSPSRRSRVGGGLAAGRCQGNGPQCEQPRENCISVHCISSLLESLPTIGCTRVWQSCGPRAVRGSILCRSNQPGARGKPTASALLTAIPRRAPTGRILSAPRSCYEWAAWGDAPRHAPARSADRANTREP